MAGWVSLGSYGIHRSWLINLKILTAITTDIMYVIHVCMSCMYACIYVCTLYRIWHFVLNNVCSCMLLWLHLLHCSITGQHAKLYVVLLPLVHELLLPFSQYILPSPLVLCIQLLWVVCDCAIGIRYICTWFPAACFLLCHHIRAPCYGFSLLVGSLVALVQMLNFWNLTDSSDRYCFRAVSIVKNHQTWQP